MEENTRKSNECVIKARALYKMNKYEAAENEFNKAIEADSMNVNAYMQYVHMCINRKEYNKARNILKKIFVIDEKNGEAYFHLGNVEYMQKNVVEARSNYLKATTYGYDEPVVLYYLAMTNLATKDVENAKFYFRKVIQKDERNVLSRIKLIEIANYEKNYGEVIAEAEQLMLYRPDAFEGYHYKFMALLDTNKTDDALMLINHAIDLFPGDYSFAYDLVLYYLKTEQYETALDYINERFEANEKAKEAIQSEKAKVLFKLARFKEAESIFDVVLTKKFNDELCHMSMVSLLGLGEWNKLIGRSEKLIQKSNDNKLKGIAWYYKAISYKMIGEEKDMRDALEQANSVLKDESAVEKFELEVYVYRALCEVLLENYEAALEIMDFAEKITDSKNGEIYYIRSIIYKKMGNEEKAACDYETANKLGNRFRELELQEEII